MAQFLLPSLLKSLLAEKPVKFKIAYVSFELSVVNADALTIACAFLNMLESEFRRVGMQTHSSVCNSMIEAVSAIHYLMKNFHSFAIKHNIRVLFVFDEIQRFFECNDEHYKVMADLFKFVCVSSETDQWPNFFFVVTGSGMAMAWRAFKSCSPHGFPLYAVICSINIPSNNSVDVQRYVYDKFAATYNCPAVVSRYFMNPACIAWHCVRERNKLLVELDIVPTLERKLLQEICGDLLALLETYDGYELKMMHQLVNNVCPTAPTISDTSYFDQFIQEFNTADHGVASRYKSFFSVSKVPPTVTKVYGILQDSTYTPILLMLFKEDGTLDGDMLRQFKLLKLPISLHMMNVMTTLSLFGEKSKELLWQHPKPNQISLTAVENAVATVFGNAISNNAVYTSLLDRPMNTKFKVQTLKPPSNAGVRLLVAFRNCAFHCDMLGAYQCFTAHGRDDQIIKLAKAVRDSGLFPEVTQYLHYL
jgi:hypothetical protein